MTTARRLLVDEEVTPRYHCVSRCVRRAFLCGEGDEHRKDWIEQRLQELVEGMAVQCAGFAVLDNHRHLLLRLDSARAQTWTAEEVAARWAKLFPPRSEKGQGEANLPAWIAAQAADEAWVAQTRQRLASLSWFMR